MLGGQDLVCPGQGWVDCKWQVPDCDPDAFVHPRSDPIVFSLLSLERACLLSFSSPWGLTLA